MTRHSIAFAAALALMLPGAALAKEKQGQGQGQGQDHSQHAEHGQQGSQSRGARAKRPKACPPGLAKKNTGCLPPGQWKKGDRLPDSWVAHFIAYGALPQFYRSRFGDDRRHRYLYRDGKVFVIDAVTHVVLDIILR